MSCFIWFLSLFGCNFNSDLFQGFLDISNSSIGYHIIQLLYFERKFKLCGDSWLLFCNSIAKKTVLQHKTSVKEEGYFFVWKQWRK